MKYGGIYADMSVDFNSSLWGIVDLHNVTMSVCSERFSNLPLWRLARTRSRSFLGTIFFYILKFSKALYFAKEIN